MAMKLLRGQCGDSLHWHLNTECCHLTIEGSGPMWDYTMENCISTHPWDNSVVSVSLPEGITHIGDYAFDHTQLSGSVKVPSTVTSIGIGAFMYTDIRVIQLNEGLLDIAPFAFYGTSMNILSIPNTVVHLGGWSIGEVGILHIPSGLESLGMSRIHLSDTPTYLCEKKPAQVVLHGDPPKIPWPQWWPVFWDLIGDVFYPDNWTDLPWLGQYHPEDEVLQNWIPYKTGTTRWIKDRTIRGVCGEKLNWELDTDYNLKITGTGAMFDFDDYCPRPWPKEISSVTFDEGITCIGAFAFEDCRLCGEIKFPVSIRSIGQNAFTGTQLHGVLRLPANLESIGNYAFACTHITRLAAGKRLATIGKGAFSQTYLKDVFLPDSLKTIGADAFWGYPTHVERIILPSGLLEIGVDLPSEISEESIAQIYGMDRGYDGYLFGRGYQGPAEIYLYGPQPTNWEKWQSVFRYMEGVVYYPDDWTDVPNPKIFFKTDDLISNNNEFIDDMIDLGFDSAETDWLQQKAKYERAQEQESLKQRWVPYPRELMGLAPEKMIGLLKIADSVKMPWG